MMEFHPYSRNLPRDVALFRPHGPVATTQPPPLYTVPPSPAYGTPYGESYRYTQPPAQQQQPQLQQPQLHQQPQPQPQLQRLQQPQLPTQSPVTPFPGPYQFPPVNHGSVHPTQRHSRSHSSPNQARLHRIGFRGISLFSMSHSCFWSLFFFYLSSCVSLFCSFLAPSCSCTHWGPTVERPSGSTRHALPPLPPPSSSSILIPPLVCTILSFLSSASSSSLFYFRPSILPPCSPMLFIAMLLLS